MKLWEALRIMEDGGKVTHQDWKADEYITSNGFGDIVDEDGVVFHLTCTHCLMDDGWEVFDERHEASEQLKNLYKAVKSIRHKIYPEYSHLMHDHLCLVDCIYDLSDILDRINKDYKLDN